MKTLIISQVRARARDLLLATADETNLLEGRDVHIHFPAGAVPKDGPSAGVTLVTALVSLFSQKRVRADTAMTGEMTLRGLVLPVGGIKDKVHLMSYYSYEKYIAVTLYISRSPCVKHVICGLQNEMMAFVSSHVLSLQFAVTALCACWAC